MSEVSDVASVTLTPATFDNGICLVCGTAHKDTGMPCPSATAGWQPIETAPRDGTDILVSGGTHGNERISCEFHGAKFSGVAIAYWDDQDKWFSGGDCDYYYPTYWMPLPTPPTGATP